MDVSENRAERLRAEYYPGGHLVGTCNAGAFQYNVVCGDIGECVEARDVKPRGVVATILCKLSGY